MVDIKKYDEIIIWGAAFPPSEVGSVSTSHGHAMEKLHVLLEKENAWKKIVCIVDSNKKIQGKKRIGVEVCIPSAILDHKEALVIINSISISSIKRALYEMGAKNDCAVIPYYFYHGTLDHPYSNEVAKNDIDKYGDEIKQLYELDDDQTRRYLDIIFSLRSKGTDELYDISFYDRTGENQAYFCDDAISPNGDVTYVDVGAFDGDSLEPVEKRYGKRLKSYIGFEPDENSLAKLEMYIKEHGLKEKTKLFPYALGDSNSKIRFSVSGSTSQESENGEVVLEQMKFDDLSDLHIEGDTLVKMDIEGAEIGALKGMAGFIKMHTPYLAICIYHKEHDLYEIAHYIKQLNQGYHLYIRGWHLECWAVPERHYK